LYVIYYWVGPEFKEYHRVNAAANEVNPGPIQLEDRDDGIVENLNCEDLENLEKSKDRAGSVAQEIKSSMNGDSKNLKTWSGFVSYESTYLALMFLELFWCRLDTIIASFYFTQTEIAVQSC
jgi:hypothetical protein